MTVTRDLLDLDASAIVGARPVHAPRLNVEGACALMLGQRDAQEDSVRLDLPLGGTNGIAVLADGLGGHAAGAVASRLAVDTTLTHMAAARNAQGLIEGVPQDYLRDAMSCANTAILGHAARNGDARGMGTTLIACLFQESRLHWLSVGDSPLYLLRSGTLKRLNATHSLAAQLDLLVRAGQMTQAQAMDHPDRNCLTSALGTSTIPLIDCPKDGLALQPGDLLLLASDGVLTLREGEIADVLNAIAEQGPGLKVKALLRSLTALAVPNQDNTALALMQFSAENGASETVPTDTETAAQSATKRTPNGLSEAESARLAEDAHAAPPPFDAAAPPLQQRRPITRFLVGLGATSNQERPPPQ